MTRTMGAGGGPGISFEKYFSGKTPTACTLDLRRSFSGSKDFAKGACRLCIAFPAVRSKSGWRSRLAGQKPPDYQIDYFHLFLIRHGNGRTQVICATETQLGRDTY